MDFRNIIRAELKKQGMSQSALARKAQMSMARVSDYLRGKREVMDGTLARMFTTLGIVVKSPRTARKSGIHQRTTRKAKGPQKPTTASKSKG